MAPSLPDPTGAPQAWGAGQIRASSRWRHVQRLIATEQLTKSWRGSYLTPNASVLVRLAALQLAVGVRLVACHQTAAGLHGFGVLDDGLLHVTTPDGRSLRKRHGVVVHQWVPRLAMSTVSGFAATSAADTAIDVCCTCDEIDVLPVLDAALRAGISDRELAIALDAAKGRRGVKVLRSWLEFADAAAESPMESRARFRAIAGGLPKPELQVPVETATGTRWLDIGWRRKRVGLEYDGQEFHSGDGRLARDRHRHNALTQAGWTILYATATDIWRNPAPLMSQLRGLIA